MKRYSPTPSGVGEFLCTTGKRSGHYNHLTDWSRIMGKNNGNGNGKTKAPQAGPGSKVEG